MACTLEVSTLRQRFLIARPDSFTSSPRPNFRSANANPAGYSALGHPHAPLIRPRIPAIPPVACRSWSPLLSPFSVTLPWPLPIGSQQVSTLLSQESPHTQLIRTTPLGTINIYRLTRPLQSLFLLPSIILALANQQHLSTRLFISRTRRCRRHRSFTNQHCWSRLREASSEHDQVPRDLDCFPHGEINC